MEIESHDVVLCEFYFSDFKAIKKRPVLVFKDNLPHDDFVAIPISSQIKNRYDDEMLLESADFIEGGIPKTSKLMIRKTFVVSKGVVLKKYGQISAETFAECHTIFCKYFGCKV